MYEKAKTITFASYYSLMLAYIILAKLKDSGVRCFIADDNFLQARPNLNQTIGGVKIKIFEKYLEKCRAILAADGGLEGQEEPEFETTGQVKCPYCGSADVRYGDAVEFKFHLPSVLMSVLFWAMYAMPGTALIATAILTGKRQNFVLFSINLSL